VKNGQVPKRSTQTQKNFEKEEWKRNSHNHNQGDGEGKIPVIFGYGGKPLWGFFWGGYGGWVGASVEMDSLEGAKKSVALKTGRVGFGT